MNRNSGSMKRSSAAAAGAAATALASVLILAACGGDNLFAGSTVSEPRGEPIIASIQVPAEVVEGSRVDIRVRAIAPRGLQSVELRYRGAVNREQTIPVSPIRTDTVVVDAFVDIPLDVTSQLLTIEAIGRDQRGGVSEIARVTVRVLDRAFGASGSREPVRREDSVH